MLPVMLFAQSIHVGDCVMRIGSGTQITGGSVVLNGTAEVNNQGTIRLTGNWINNANGITPGGSGTVNMVGTASQAIIGDPTTFHHLIVNNTAGVILGSDTLAVTGVLTLQNGNINGEAANATVDIVPGGSVVRVFGWVRGNMRKRVPAGSPTVVFEVGNSTLYTPATLSFSGVSTPGRYSVKPVAGLQPNVGSSCINFTRRVNQYWQIRNEGVAPANYNINFRYGSSMFVGSPSAALLRPAQFTGSEWVYPNITGTPTVTLLNAGPASGEGDFVLSHGCEAPANDERNAAVNLNVQAFGLCATTNGFISGATVSPQSNSSTVTGEDVWYRFVANSPGARIVVASTEFNALVELQDAAGNTLDVENVLSGTGTEMMNYYSPVTPLVNGQTYYVAVRNYNSATATGGTFSICVQRIARTLCNQGPGPYTLCQTFKSTSVGAVGYSFVFTNTTTLQTHQITTTGGLTVVPLSGLLPDYDYSVSLQAHFSLPDGAGNLDVFTIDTPDACSLTMSPHAGIVLRDIDRCAAGPRPANAMIAANTWLCGTSFYQWEFTPTSPSGLTLPLVNGPPNNRYLNLPSAGISQGTTYSVRIRPIFQNVIPGMWGAPHCLQIAGPVPMTLLGDEVGELTDGVGDSFASMLYPNPSNGTSLSVRTLSEDDGVVRMRILDAAGRLVHAEQWNCSSPESVQTIRFNQAVASGIYTVELLNGDSRLTQKWVVER